MASDLSSMRATSCFIGQWCMEPGGEHAHPQHEPAARQEAVGAAGRKRVRGLHERAHDLLVAPDRRGVVDSAAVGCRAAVGCPGAVGCRGGVECDLAGEFPREHVRADERETRAHAGER